MKVVTHNEVKNVVKHAYNKKTPIFLWGTMGIGKSSIIKDVADELGVEFIDVRISQLEPSDLRGLPKVDGNETKWLSPNWLPKGNDTKGILFFDELNLAVPSIQASCYQLILDRRLGDYVLPNGWVIVSAGNRFEDKANVFEMPSPLSNRFIHVELGVPSVETWNNWAFEHNIDNRIIAFLSFKNSRLFGFDSKNKDKSFPTPRTWEYTSNLIKGLNYETDKELLDILIASAVGEGTAIEMSAFMKLQRKVKVDEILENPKKIKDIKEIDLKYSLMSSISDYYNKNRKEKAISKQILAVIDELDAEFGVLLFRLCKYSGGTEKVKEFMSEFSKLPEFKTGWAEKNAKYLI